MSDKKTNISNWSINLLKSDNPTRYKWYVQWIREDKFEPYFVVWKAFASCMESRAKIGDYNMDWNIERMKQEFIKAERLDDYEKSLVQFYELLQNAQLAITVASHEAEKEYIVELNDDYNLKVKVDADYIDFLLDHKAVSSFTKEEDKEEKYWQQAKLYQYAKYKVTGAKQKIIFCEILKKKAPLPTKKDDLLSMLSEEQRELALQEKRTVDSIKQVLYLHTKIGQIRNDLVFERNDDIISYCEDLLARAIKKADYLKSLSPNEVL